MKKKSAVREAIEVAGYLAFMGLMVGIYFAY